MGMTILCKEEDPILFCFRNFYIPFKSILKVFSTNSWTSFPWLKTSLHGGQLPEGCKNACQGFIASVSVVKQMWLSSHEDWIARNWGVKELIISMRDPCCSLPFKNCSLTETNFASPQSLLCVPEALVRVRVLYWDLEAVRNSRISSHYFLPSPNCRTSETIPRLYQGPSGKFRVLRRLGWGDCYWGGGVYMLGVHKE